MTLSEYIFGGPANTHWQTLTALAVVAATVLWLVLRTTSKSRRVSGCGGSGCGAVSKDAKKLKAHLATRMTGRVVGR
ncbi:MAG TPA: hypothetical protein PLN52_02065 [Opitutaceae bacterium]|nr:hypothetical protein [Opitutaceae bacterium]